MAGPVEGLHLRSKIGVQFLAILVLCQQPVHLLGASVLASEQLKTSRPDEKDFETISNETTGLNISEVDLEAVKLNDSVKLSTKEAGVTELELKQTEYDKEFTLENLDRDWVTTTTENHLARHASFEENDLEILDREVDSTISQRTENPTDFPNRRNINLDAVKNQMVARKANAQDDFEQVKNVDLKLSNKTDSITLGLKIETTNAKTNEPTTLPTSLYELSRFDTPADPEDTIRLGRLYIANTTNEEDNRTNVSGQVTQTNTSHSTANGAADTVFKNGIETKQNVSFRLGDENSETFLASLDKDKPERAITMMFPTDKIPEDKDINSTDDVDTDRGNQYLAKTTVSEIRSSELTQNKSVRFNDTEIADASILGFEERSSAQKPKTNATSAETYKVYEDITMSNVEPNESALAVAMNRTDLSFEEKLYEGFTPRKLESIVFRNDASEDIDLDGQTGENNNETDEGFITKSTFTSTADPTHDSETLNATYTETSIKKTNITVEERSRSFIGSQQQFMTDISQNNSSQITNLASRLHAVEQLTANAEFEGKDTIITKIDDILQELIDKANLTQGLVARFAKLQGQSDQYLLPALYNLTEDKGQNTPALPPEGHGGNMFAASPWSRMQLSEYSKDDTNNLKDNGLNGYSLGDDDTNIPLYNLYTTLNPNQDNGEIRSQYLFDYGIKSHAQAKIDEMDAGFGDFLMEQDQKTNPSFGKHTLNRENFNNMTERSYLIPSSIEKQHDKFDSLLYGNRMESQGESIQGSSRADDLAESVIPNFRGQTAPLRPNPNTDYKTNWRLLKEENINEWQELLNHNTGLTRVGLEEHNFNEGEPYYLGKTSNLEVGNHINSLIQPKHQSMQIDRWSPADEQTVLSTKQSSSPSSYTRKQMWNPNPRFYDTNSHLYGEDSRLPPRENGKSRKVINDFQPENSHTHYVNKDKNSPAWYRKIKTVPRFFTPYSSETFSGDTIHTDPLQFSNENESPRLIKRDTLIVHREKPRRSSGVDSSTRHHSQISRTKISASGMMPSRNNTLLTLGSTDTDLSGDKQLHLFPADRFSSYNINSVGLTNGNSLRYQNSIHNDGENDPVTISNIKSEQAVNSNDVFVGKDLPVIIPPKSNSLFLIPLNSYPTKNSSIVYFSNFISNVSTQLGNEQPNLNSTSKKMPASIRFPSQFSFAKNHTVGVVTEPVMDSYEYGTGEAREPLTSFNSRLVNKKILQPNSSVLKGVSLVNISEDSAFYGGDPDNVPDISAYKAQDFSLRAAPSNAKTNNDKMEIPTNLSNTITTPAPTGTVPTNMSDNYNYSSSSGNNNNNNNSNNNNNNTQPGSMMLDPVPQTLSAQQLQMPVVPMLRARSAVSAVLTSHFGPTKDRMIPFDLELLDLGDNYDNSSGTFICTAPGTYVIALHLMAHPGAKVNARVHVNSRPIAALWADDNGGAGFYPSSSTHTLAHLDFGDQVYVMLVDGGYGESWVHANYNGFSVYLLYEDLSPF